MTPEQDKRCRESWWEAGTPGNDIKRWKQAYAAAIEREFAPVAAERDRYREALEECRDALSRVYSDCGDLGHKPGEFHSSDECCPAAKAVNAAKDKADNALKAGREGA